MHSTGIVRRIDDLGRIVIPKEIRKTMHVAEGDALELYMDKDTGTVTFAPYCPLSDWKIPKEVMNELWPQAKSDGANGLALIDGQSAIIGYGSCVGMPKTNTTDDYRQSLWDEVHTAYAGTRPGKTETPLVIFRDKKTIRLYPIRDRDYQDSLLGAIVLEINNPKEDDMSGVAKDTDIRCFHSARIIAALSA